MSRNKEQLLEILALFPGGVGMSDLSRAMGAQQSRRTLQRHMGELLAEHLVVRVGLGRGTLYRLKPTLAERVREPDQSYEVYVPLTEEGREILSYVRQPVAARSPVAFDRALLDEYTPNKSWYLEKRTRERLRRLGSTGDETRPAGTYGRAILDRLLIDLSWASSRLEGNTYSRLDTARLIELGETPDGQDSAEAQMILNHKRAIELLVDDAEEIGFNKYTLLNLHGLLSENLLVDPTASGRLRSRPVEISGSVFKPTGVPQLIEETFDILLDKANAIDDAIEQAFFIMVHIPYLQPFEDVNKRVSRLAANISLIKENLCPLTFLDVPERAYVDGILGIYELSRVELLKDVFIWAFERSAQQYTEVKRSMAQPDPLRLQYRQQLYEIIGSIVRSLQIDHIKETIWDFAAASIKQDDRADFVDMALDDIKRLHIGVIARYRVRPSEFEAWKSKRSTLG